MTNKKEQVKDPKDLKVDKITKKTINEQLENLDKQMELEQTRLQQKGFVKANDYHKNS